MKPKVYGSNDTNFGKNELNNQNYLQLNYQFKFRYLNENVQIAADKLTMDLPIDLSIKRTSPDESSKLVISGSNEKEIDRRNGLNKQNDNYFNDNKNEAKLLPYLLMSSNQNTNLTSRSSINSQKIKLNDCKNNNNEASSSSTFHSDADLLKYNKKKLFLASVRKQSSSIDISNLSSNGTTSSSSSSSNSPNSTPSHITSHQSTKSDRRNSSSSISSTNLTLSPNSDNQSNDDLDNQPTIKELENLYQQQNDLINGDKIFDNRLYQSPNSFSKKFEYFSKYYKINELKEENLIDNGESINDNKSINNHHLNNSNKIKSNLNNENIKIQNNLNYLKCIEHPMHPIVQTCNNKSSNIGLKRSFSESYLLEQKQENIINLLTYKRRQLKKCRSENDLSDLIKLYRCNEKHLNGIKFNGNLNNTKKEKDLQNENKEIAEKLKQQLQQQQQQSTKQQQFTNNSVIKDYQRSHYDEQYELKRQLIDKQQKEQMYLRNQTINDDDLTSYTKQLIRNQKSIYQFSQFNQHHLNNKFDEFDKLKSLPLNLQLNRNKASLNFNNSQLFNNKKSVINNEKTGKRKFTKLASDEDEEDLEDEDENEDNIIVDHLSNTASSSVSPNSIQSNSDLTVINKQLLTKHHHLNIGHQLNNHHLNLERHHLETHSDNGLVDLGLPFINHPSLLNRRTIQNNKQNFGNLPDLLPADLINEPPANVSKDGLNSWKFYKDYYYLLLNQPDSPAKLNALQWIMKDLNEKNNNHINLAEDWTLDPELVKLNSYKQSYSSLDNSPINLTMFNNLNRSTNSNLIDKQHQLLNTSRIEKFNSVTNSPPQPINLTNLQLTPENYLQYVKMNENLINNNRHNSQQLQIITGQSYLNLDNSNHCLPPGTPNSFQDRKRISRPLTGRHVRQGTGASPTTLANLRSMIKERQKFRELNGLGVNNGKKFRKKRK